MEIKQYFKTGMPSLIEWRYRWKSHKRDSWPDNAEEYAAMERLYQELEGKGYSGTFYIEGGGQGDRTLILVVTCSTALTLDLIRSVQSFLRRPENDRWRIYLPLYLGIENDIMVYPRNVRWGAFEQEDLPAYFPHLQSRFAKEIDEG